MSNPNPIFDPHEQQMVDLRGPQDVQFVYEAGRLYVHVDGITVLRIYECPKPRITTDVAIHQK